LLEGLTSQSARPVNPWVLVWS